MVVVLQSHRLTGAAAARSRPVGAGGWHVRATPGAQAARAVGDVGGIGVYWVVLNGTGRYWVVLGGTGLYWDVLGCTKLRIAVCLEEKEKKEEKR